MKLFDFFAQHPVFTYEEFTSFLDADGPRSVRTRDSLLAYHTRTGRILRVKRGLYASIPFGASPETFPVDMFLLAGKMSDDAVLAYHTALDFYGKAHSVREEFLFLTGRAIRPLNFRGCQFRAIRFPQALVDNKKEFFGVDTAERAGLPVKVASLERTLVDILDRPDLAGGWEEIWRSLETIAFFDVTEVLAYALLLGNKTTIAKVGFYLDGRREELMLDDASLEPFREHRPHQPTYMVRHDRGSKTHKYRYVENWNLLVPEYILHQSWGEVA